MLKKNSGFTMIELLAAVVVLGILMMVAVPTVMEVLRDSKNDTYVDDAIRLVSTMEYTMNKDNKIPYIGKGSCLIINLTYLDNNTFNDAPYDGEYERTSSFVVARRWTDQEKQDMLAIDANRVKNYSYYVRLVEKLPGAGEGYRGVNLTEVDQLYEKNAADQYVVSIDGSANDTLVFDLTQYMTPTPTTSSDVLTGELLAKLSGYGISCNTVTVYSSNRETE